MRSTSERLLLDIVDKQANPAPRDRPFFKKILTSHWFLCGCVGLVAFALGLYRLGEPSLWFDEILSVERASQSFITLWRIVNASEPNMALYYFILHFWLNLTAWLGFLPTELIVRFPSALSAAGASIFVYLLAQRFLGFPIGLAVAALYTFNNLQMLYMQEARSYALQLLFLNAGWYALTTVLTTEKHQYRNLACYVAMMTLSVYTHYFSLLIFFSQGVALILLYILPTRWRQRVRQLARPLLISALLIVVLVIPMLLVSRVGAQTSWIPIPTLKTVKNLFKTFANQNKTYLFSFLLLTVLGLLVAILVSVPSFKELCQRKLVFRRFASRSGQLAENLPGFEILLFCWLLLPIGVSYILTQKSIHLFLPRYLVTVVPAFCLLAGVGLVALPWQKVRRMAVVGLTLVALAFVPQHYASAQAEEWNTASLWMKPNYQAGDGLVCFDNLKGCQIGLEYYFRVYAIPAHFDADSPGSFSYVEYDLRRPAYRPDVEQAVDVNRLQAYAAVHSRLFYIVARLPNAQEIALANTAVSWLNSHYKLLDSIQTSTVTIYLYDTGH
ncbi:MAG TPA: glycosyltransferase family 39 protein [Ktedonobacteraceae bacterium]|nr:glycosyltransferase family 39 protein [Ktedonobacteraceae bacterium]